MILVILITIPLLAGLIAWLVGRWSSVAARAVCLIYLVANLGVTAGLWVHHAGLLKISPRGPWLLEFALPWIPQWGISFYLALDGLSLLLIALTNFIGIMGVAASWTSIQKRVGFFHFNLMWLLSAIIAVFLAMDLFLFYFVWEVMLVPLYLLIGIWGYQRRIYATIKFFIFTQGGSLLMLVGILCLYFAHHQASGVYSFKYQDLVNTPLSSGATTWVMLAFFVAFAVKLPAVPVHSWLPDAHTEAPTAGSVYLASLVLKAGGYGLMRFLVPLFPAAAMDFRPVAMTLAVIGILYGAIMAFAQRDLKRLVAYTSISHMGFVLLGVFAWNELALQGAIIVMLAHGLSTGALFMLVGGIQDRIHTRDMNQMGGLWAVAPRLGGLTTLFSLASLGLPAMANFVGEFLVLLGTYRVSPPAAIAAALGLIVSVVYSLWLIQRVFHGPLNKAAAMPDLSVREMAMMAPMVLASFWIGLYPQPELSVARPAVQGLIAAAGGGAVAPVDVMPIEAMQPPSPDAPVSAATTETEPAPQGGAAQ